MTHKKAVVMLIVDQFESGTFKTAAIIEEVDVYYSQEILCKWFFLGSTTFYGFKIFGFTTFYGFKDFYGFYNILWFQGFFFMAYNEIL